jgi:hypothetical protein
MMIDCFGTVVGLSRIIIVHCMLLSCVSEGDSCSQRASTQKGSFHFSHALSHHVQTQHGILGPTST